MCDFSLRVYRVKIFVIYLCRVCHLFRHVLSHVSLMLIVHSAVVVFQSCKSIWTLVTLYIVK